MKFDRIVLDTNIYIAFKRTLIADIFFEHGKIIYSCPQQIQEYTRVANYKKIKDRYTVKPNTDIFYDVTMSIEV